VGNMEWTTFIAMLAVNATLAMPPPCAFDPFLTPFCAQHLAAKDYFENLYQVTHPFPSGSTWGGMGDSCGSKGRRPPRAFGAFASMVDGCASGHVYSGTKRTFFLLRLPHASH
jgi:hypothetical protein